MFPQGTTADRSKGALALSGGGFRATLFHIGSICRLNELGLLAQLERISSVSGGSITAGLLASKWSKLKRDANKFTDLGKEVVEPLREFCTRRVDEHAIAVGTLSPFATIGDKLAELYADALVGNLTMQDLPDKPQFVFNATNLQTGRLVRIQKVRLADYSIGEIHNPRVPLAKAMAASSAFSPILSPVTIDCALSDWMKLEGARHFGEEHFCRRLSLTDGGAYDNLGLETIDDFATIFVSDAGAPFSVEEEAHTQLAKQTLRAFDIATDQARLLRRRLLFSETSAHNAQTGAAPRVFALAAIDDDLDDPNTAKRLSAPRILRVDCNIVGPLAAIRTRLNPFSDEEQGRLINWGWYLTDLAVRARIASAVAPPTSWLVPQCALG
jgi:NTE family protein